jgi:hypothetical protein
LVQSQPNTGKWWTLGALVAVLVGNAAPLLAVYLWDWHPSTVLLIYWIETVIIGLLTTVKLLLALPGYRPQPGRRVRYQQKSGGNSRSFETGEASRLWIVPSFVLIYGGASALVLFIGAALLGRKVDLADMFREMTADWRQWLPLLGMLLVEHIADFFRDFFRGPAWVRSDPIFHAWRPAGRFVLFYLLILAGAMLLQFFSAHAVVILFVALKLIGELCNVPFGEVRWERTPPLAESDDDG